MADLKVPYDKENKTQEEALECCYEVYRDGIDFDTVQDYYTKWAKTYEQDMDTCEYRCPQEMTVLFNRWYPDKKDIAILNFAGGTGLQGVELAKYGFKTIDCIDCNDTMLELAREKGVFRNVIKAKLGWGNKLDIPDNTYDASITSGTFVEGHLRADCFEEIIRVTKLGGIVMGDIFLSKKTGEIESPYLRETFPAITAQHEADGLWKLEWSKDFDGLMANTRFYVYRITKAK